MATDRVWEQPRLEGEWIVGAVDAAAQALCLGDGPCAAELIDQLVTRPSATGGDAAVDVALAGALERAVGLAWQRGWQPADVVRAVRRVRSGVHVAIAAKAITTEAKRYSAFTIDPRWRAQLVAVAGEQRCREEGRGTRREVVTRTVEVLALLVGLPSVPRLLPLPGAATSARTARASIDGRLLERVRALLAKAESTTFPEEADALTAKAQELMTRHSIDQAMLDAGRGAGAAAEGRRVGIDDPYAGPKSLLLSRVADANRCRAVWLGDLGCSDVFGGAGDLDAVELLFTSLLRQATAAMLAERPARRTRAFRQSFLVAFAVRIGERLREQDDLTAVTAVDQHGPDVLPVLAAKATAADEAAEAAFPDRVRKAHTASDAAGWAAGTVAAELASLRVRAEVDEAAG
jgi:hypothetical protein